MVDTIRYYVALLVLLALPPGLMLWYAIHPFVHFWRRLGPVWTYVVLSVPSVGLCVLMFLARATLLGQDLGMSYPLTALGALFFVAGTIIALMRRKHLTGKILTGYPELAPEKHPTQLLTSGIYSRVRHPRYLEAILFILGYALFANYSGLYGMVVLSVIGIYLVVLLEERELRERFGAEHEDYCRRVPRFIPRWKGDS